MNISKKIYEKSNNLIATFNTRNPKKIIAETGIELFYVDYFKDLLGMYTYKWKHRAIFINNKLNEHQEKIVLAHELGHDTLHKNLMQDTLLKEFVILNTKNSTEYEANAFASHILLDSEDVIYLLSQGMNIYRIAQELETDVNLLAIKIREMKKLGYKIVLPIEINQNFLIKK